MTLERLSSVFASPEIVQIVEDVDRREMPPGLYDLPQDDLAIPAFEAASQTFALLAIADALALVSGGGVSVGDALHPVPR